MELQPLNVSSLSPLETLAWPVCTCVTNLWWLLAPTLLRLGKVLSVSVKVYLLVEIKGSFGAQMYTVVPVCSSKEAAIGGIWGGRPHVICSSQPYVVTMSTTLWILALEETGSVIILITLEIIL